MIQSLLQWQLEVRGDNLNCVQWLMGKWLPRDPSIVALLNECQFLVALLARHIVRASRVATNLAKHVPGELNQEADQRAGSPQGEAWYFEEKQKYLQIN